MAVPRPFIRGFVLRKRAERRECGMAGQKRERHQLLKMRIIIHVGGNYLGDGPEAKRMRAFREAFVKKGHEVKILSPSVDKKIIAPEGVCFCPVVPLKSKSTVNRLLNGVSFGVSSVFMALKLGKADVVISTSPPALISPFGWIIAKCKGAKLVYDVRDIWPDVAWEMGSFTKTSVYSRVFALIRDFMLRRADLTTTVSPGKVSKLRGYYPQGKILEISNGFNTHFLENEEMPEIVEQFHLDDIFSCVYVGNLGLAQGLEQLLYVARKAKEKGLCVQFLLFGSGIEEGPLKRYTAEHKLDNVHFPGKLPNEKIYTVLRYAKMSFIPLVNERLKDSIPTKMYEALGVGCPVLLAAAGDAAEVLRESGLGIAVRPNDKEALWSGFCQMYQSMDEIMKNRGKTQLLMKTKHSLQNSAERLEKELGSLCGENEGIGIESGNIGAA